MAEAGLALGLKSIPVVTEHYDKVYDPLKDKTKQGIRKVKGMRDRRNGGGYESESDEYDYDGPPARRSTTGGGRRRSPRDDIGRRRSGRDDGSVVEERYAYRGPASRAKSVGRDGGRGDRRRGGGSRRDYSDSESSISPRPRERRKSLGEKALVALGLTSAGGAAASGRSSRGKSRSRRDRSISSDYSTRRRDDRGGGPPRSSRGYDDDNDRTPARYKPRAYIGNGSDSEPGSQLARRNNNGDVGPRKGGSEKGGEKKKHDKSSDSDLCSSSEDERRTRKMKGKEYLTAGLAAVATIHAAHNVYSSMEARDKRHHQVATGEMSPEEAKKLKNKARLQDAAAIGIAALGIKGAYSEWQEVQENRHELAEQTRTRAERHEKRVKQGLGKYASQQGGSDGGYSRNRSEPPRKRDRDDKDYY